MLEEIVLVDDASERDFLKRPLESYVKKLKVPVHIIQMEQRSGLIRTRLRGAAVSQGEVITFLDVHCECTVGWLEPLLARIKHDRRTVVCPIIDVISDDTFEYMVGSDMTYVWKNFGDCYLLTCWTCVSEIYTLHISRRQSINKNNRRLAEVWMDEFKNFFYIISPGVTKVDYGTISSRLGLRHKLECRPFSLYLENIYPDSQISHQYFSLGELRNVFSYTANKEIRTDDLCLDVSNLNDPVTMLKCHHLKGSQLRKYDPHVNSNQCLDKATDEDSHVPSIRDCNGSWFQQWLL
ncbi:hypothetical protein Celaphus_00006389 [Cervus elaphus hippelaphus]|uniref:Polypeptide N-acetylgalactosaminyltransferase n=1 Tax=Cervus elaphus hippelaphus TaxID=46360 RepID=A0A212CV73_CEREH|nr:hypothetical protein Celaphus_00006389 [Cervus elaphus hippelaphus]